MSDINREIQELLVDYAGALRDGCIPAFLKSLTREEGRRIASSNEFWDATEIVRVLNGAAFADRAVTADVSLFMSRVNANIVSRLKKARGVKQRKRRMSAKSTNKSQTTEKQIWRLRESTRKQSLRTRAK
jgi:hypothetical protein